tara:strand:- start:8957 stop:9463 length:507 start_codon:yes stop_codon:yes gene_type:complete
MSILKLFMLTVLIIGAIGLITHDILYYSCFGHVCGSVTIWLAVLICHHILSLKTGASNLEAFFPCIAPIFFFCGREFRDLEKLGKMDWYGLLMPVVSSLVLSVAIVIKNIDDGNLDKLGSSSGGTDVSTHSSDCPSKIIVTTVDTSTEEVHEPVPMAIHSDSHLIYLK